MLKVGFIELKLIGFGVVVVVEVVVVDVVVVLVDVNGVSSVSTS